MKDRSKERAQEKQRRERRLAVGCCGECDNLSLPGLSLCEKHKQMIYESNRRMYRKRLATDLCVDCMQRPRKIGITRCEECSSYHAGLAGKHGATIEKRRELLALQAGKCAICHKSIDALANVDHDHETGKIRGLLCGRCNKAMGWFSDDPALLRYAADYLDSTEWIGACGRLA